MVGKSPLEPLGIMSSRHGKFVAISDGSAFVTTPGDSVSKAGSGECLPELPQGGLSATTTSHRNDLQEESSSLPVENSIGTQVDTTHKSEAQSKEGQVEIKNRNNVRRERKKIQKGTQVLGYVPIKILNLSLEEVELGKQMCVGVASPYMLMKLRDMKDMI